MANEERPEVEPTADELEETEPGLETLDDADVKSLYPGAHKDSITGEWIMLEQRRPRANGRHEPRMSGVDRLRQRLHTGNAIMELPALEWLVEGLLYTPGESVLYSPPKLAKTFWALDLHLSIATGRDFHGRRVRQGPSLYIAGEGVGGMGKRVAAWSEYVGEENLSSAFFLTTAVNLGDPKGMTVMLELIAELEPSLIVIDTLHRCMPGMDENTAQDIGKVITSLDAMRGRASDDDGGGHILCVHHTGKDTAKGMRGNSALLGAVDTTIELSGDRNGIRVVNTAQKDDEPAADFWCSLESVPTHLGNSAVVVPMPAGGAVSSKLADQVVDALESLPAGDRTASKWQRMAEANGMPERSFWRGKKEALESGMVAADSEGRGALFSPVEPEPEPEANPELELEDAG